VEEAPAPVAEEATEGEKPARKARAPRAAKTPLEDLVIDQEIQGKVRSVMAYGAFVDIGAATDGLLHVSEISNEFVKDASEKLSVGDEVTVRIKSINLEKKQMALTAKDPNAEPPARAPRGEKVDLSEFEGADEKAFITGTVSRVQDYGAFISLKPGVDGLVHISQIQEGGVSAVADVLSAGQEVQVRIIKVEPDKRRIGLSMLPWVPEAERPQRKKRESSNFDTDDTEFHLSSEELEALTDGDEFEESPFDTAFTRMQATQEAKKAGKFYSHSV